MAYLEVEHVSLTRKKQLILDDVTLSGELGQVVGIVGENGSGKSMLFKTICGFTTLTSGKIKVGGEIIGQTADFPSHTGMLIESPGFIPSLTGYQNLYSLALLTKETTKKQINVLLELVGLADKKDMKVSKYSLGMKQRLGIAQALLDDPTLVILDEPFNGLDNKGITLLLQIIKDLKARQKLILLTSHRIEDLEEVSDTFYYVEGGVYQKGQGPRL